MDIAGNSGPKPVVTFGGKAYSFSYFCPAVVTLLESAVVDLAYADADALTGRAKERALAAVDAAVVAGQHRYGEVLFNRRAGTLRGSPLVLWASVAHNHPEFTLDQAREMATAHPVETARALARVEPGFFAELVRLGAMSADQMAAVLGKRAEQVAGTNQASPAGSENTPPS